MLLKKPIYLDYNSTTPTEPRVLEAMMPYFTEKFGNPHSSNHSYGWETEEAIEIAREHIASVISCKPNDIIFTSGATESNNLAIKGAASFFKKFVTDKNHIITAATEHKCVLEACYFLAHEGFEVTFLDVDSEGHINIKELENCITDKTFLVSIMMANNEIGTIQDIQSIGEICRENNIWFHTDAAQAFGKIPIDVNAMSIDMLSISGHKIYAPKGIGALYIRSRAPKIRLLPIINGGRQEKGIRPGTIPTPLAVGLGEAARIAENEMTASNIHIQTLTQKMLDALQSIDGVVLHGSTTNRIPGNINIGVENIGSGSLISSLKQIAVSSGSACTSSEITPSYVLKAINVAPELATNSIRIGIGRFTTEEEIDIAIDTITRNINLLRKKAS